MFHGLLFTVMDAYGVLQKSLYGAKEPTIELLSRAFPLFRQDGKDSFFEDKIPVSEEKPKAAVEEEEELVRRQDASWEQDLSDELKKFKTEAERKIFLTYYEYLSLAIGKNTIYPKLAQERGLSGVVYIVFSLDENGGLIRSVLRKSSGSAILDRAAMQAVERAAPFAPLPKGLKQKAMNFYVPIHFKRGS